MSMLSPCLSLGVNQIRGDQDSSFFETTQSVLLDLISHIVQQLPETHHIFQPLTPIEKDSYLEKLVMVLGKSSCLNTFNEVVWAYSKLMYIFAIPVMVVDL